jgi:hypothetical protein
MLSTISFSIAGCRHNCALEAADFHVGSAGAGFLLDCALLGIICSGVWIFGGALTGVV